MPKITPEIFSNLPEELQNKILEDVPADELNNIRVVMLNADTEEEVMERLWFMLEELHREQLKILCVEMARLAVEERVSRDGKIPNKEFILALIPGLIEAVIETIIESQNDDSDD